MELVLCILFGWLGAHKFYAKKPSLGILYLFTFGLFGVGWVMDTLTLFKSKSVSKFTSVVLATTIPEVKPKYETTLEGAKYLNEDGTSRIDYIKDVDTVTLLPDTYAGAPAIRVLALTGHTLGWVPKTDVESVMKALANGMVYHVELCNASFSADGMDCTADIKLASM